MNCKNCGAPQEGLFCEYCGTPNYTPQQAFENMRGKICHCWYEDDNKNKILFDIRVNTIEQKNYFMQTYFDYDWHRPITTETQISLEGSLRDFDRKKWKRYLNEM